MVHNGLHFCVTCDICKELLDPEVKENGSKPGVVKSSHYIGMCAVTLHKRHKTHREQHQKRNPNNVMVKHEKEKHNGEVQNYTARLIQSDKGLLHISLREAILIAGQHYGTSMYDRLERGKGTGIIRIETTMRQGFT